jgi:hypothetical protein
LLGKAASCRATIPRREVANRCFDPEDKPLFFLANHYVVLFMVRGNLLVGPSHSGPQFKGVGVAHSLRHRVQTTLSFDESLCGVVRHRENFHPSTTRSRATKNISSWASHRRYCSRLRRNPRLQPGDQAPTLPSPFAKSRCRSSKQLLRDRGQFNS